VTSIGGTYIETVAYNLPTITTEIAWIDGGGGASTYEPKPAYQTNALLGTVATIDPTKRAVPDVAYNAAQGSAVATVMGGLWYYEAGTSEGAPQWAAIAALIAQDRANKKETTLQALMKATTNGFNGFLYQAKVDSTGLFNITEGSDQSTLMTTTCAICLAGKGYNAATGFGVPNVTNLLAFF
jgi:kumamolisin